MTSLFIVFMLCRLLMSENKAIPNILYGLLCLLPLGWSIGLLPPIDSFFFWLSEQTFVHLLGGTPMASESR